MLFLQRLALVVSVMISAASLSGCREDKRYVEPSQLDGQVVGNQYCDTVQNLVDMGLIHPRHLETNKERVGQSIQPLYVSLWAVWPTRQIPVCWEDSSYDPARTLERLWVQDAVTKTWEAALCDEMIPAEECLKFVGWTRCSEGNDTGVRIQVADLGAQTLLLGSSIAGVPRGVRFNFTFNNWSPLCKGSEADREFCIRAIAAHEFGHVLGLAHEQNRRDTPGTCDEAPQGSNGNVYLGPWDPESIMNYCASDWNNNGELSQGDKDWIKAAYYPEYYDELCVPLRIYDPALM